ncbi:hypothetical protein CWI37_0177p0030 [Hamiltosporidium tvaerminnensis]|uniref:RanBD1 domain-containing protein n=1 Tax=Hamiltosporidium tvaerminnensis TaxID=1176355 RepID=A0A4Q9LBD0_9MICR|nr:E3 SUMO-protein ligase RanBP2 [Hamiltosporidium tvaerminnensis]TBU04150.1 hypothetical protein CWI37_0177p0030 [Hamiltosporidium tvaerminnensis]
MTEKKNDNEIKNNIFEKKPEEILTEYKQKESIFVSNESEVQKKEPSAFLESTVNKPTPKNVDTSGFDEIPDCIFQKESRLYKFINNVWSDIGRGHMIITETENKKRILFVREGLKLTFLNFYITYDLKADLKENSVSFIVYEAIENTDEKSETNYSCSIYAIKFKENSSASEFYNLIKFQEEILEKNKE